MGYGWEGKLVRLVPRDKKHFDNAYRWVNDPTVTAGIGVGDFPVTRMEQEERYQQLASPRDDEVAFAIELLTGEHIGFSGIHHIDWQNRSAVTGTLIGAREHWGKGCGTDASLVRVRYCFEVLGLRYLTSTVIEGNQASLKMLKKSGYVECARYPKKIWKRGKLLDEIHFYMTREMWEQVSKS